MVMESMVKSIQESPTKQLPDYGYRSSSLGSTTLVGDLKLFLHDRSSSITKNYQQKSSPNINGPLARLFAGELDGLDPMVQGRL